MPTHSSAALAQNMLTIGQLAHKLAVSTDSIRFYEKQQLIKPVTRNAAGYRLYNQQSITVLAFILSAKRIGFTLQEIKYLLEIDLNKKKYACSTVKDFVNAKHTQVIQRIKDLQHIENALSKLSTACCGGEVSAEHCSILTSLEKTNTENPVTS